MRPRTRRAWLLLVSIAVILGIFQTPLLGTTRGWVWAWLVAAAGRFGGYTVIDDRSAVRESALLAENIRLKAELQDYSRLKTQLGTPSFAEFRTVPVALAGRPLDTFQSKFLLSKGARDGLVLGAPLVVNSSALIGFIAELSETTAVGQLVLAPETTLAAQVAPTDADATLRATGLVRGQHYTSLLLTTVPRDVPLKADQAVVTEAKVGVVPFGLLLGTINSIQSSENDVYQEATLTLPYDVDQLRAAVVLLPR